MADVGRTGRASGSNASVHPAHRSPTRLSVVIPAKNEARNIGWVVGRMPSIVDQLVLVDGLSTDETIEVTRSLWPGLVVVHDDQPGKGAALRAGFAAASGDYIVMMDADGSMDPREIPRFVEKLEQGSDLVKGSRFLAGGGSADISTLRSLGNRALRDVANLLLDTSFSELCYGFAAFRRTTILELGLDAIGFEVETQLFLRAIRNGLDVQEVPSFEAPRRSGTSNLHTFRDGWRVLRTILSERSRPGRPRRDLPDETGVDLETPERVSVPLTPGHLSVSGRALRGD